MTDKRPLWVLVIACALFFAFGGKGGAIFTPPPIDGEGLHVLVVYESSDALPKGQRAILNSNSWKEGAQWRILDKDSHFNDETSIWKKALDRPSEHLPRVIVSNKGGFEGPLPADIPAMDALVGEYR